MITDDNLKRLQTILGVNFHDAFLLQEALTHSSYVNENPRATSNERLEFVGDAVLGLILAEKLFHDHPDLAEGDLTKMRSQLICRASLAAIARTFNLGEYLFLGRGEEASGGGNKSANLAGAIEAIIAAVYLDCDWHSTQRFVLHLFKDSLASVCDERRSDDHKSRLQEVLQQLFKIAPVYRVVTKTGPDHDRQFTVEVMLEEKVLARGTGPSKKLAEAQSAQIALETLGQNTPP